MIYVASPCGMKLVTDYDAQYMMYDVRRMVYGVQCDMYDVLCVVYDVRTICIMYTIWYDVRCIMHGV